MTRKHKGKIVYAVVGEGAVQAVFDSAAPAYAMALQHNQENDNWKSIDTKWWVSKHEDAT